MKPYLQLLAPYIAVLICWNIFQNAWAAIALYHLQILFWAVHAPRKKLFGGFNLKYLVFAVPAAAAGPALYLLLPFITRTELSEWLSAYGLAGPGLAAMIPYFGIIHPLLEQIHWSRLREQTALAHPLFAGYHLLVLASLLTLPWLSVCFIILLTASVCWQYFTRKTGNLLLPVFSHILADLSLILAAWIIVC